MTEEQFRAVLDLVGANADGDWLQFPEGNTVTFQVAREGVGFSVSRSTAVKSVGDLVQIRTEKGDTCVVVRDQIFAATVDASGRAMRRAGFG